jgi:hypothetical protein
LEPLIDDEPKQEDSNERRSKVSDDKSAAEYPGEISDTH